MNEVMNSLLTRRSTRAFLDKEISGEILEQIARAGIYAPSGMNRQTWKFTVVNNRKKIQTFAEVIGEKLGREGYDMYKPQVLIIPSNERESPYGKEDNACALENIFLAAHSFDIGSVWINQVRDICDVPEVRNILKEWGIPDSHVVYGMAALGYPAQNAANEVKKTGEIHFVE